MNVHFIYDQGNADGTKGGAELTMAEFEASAPDGVTLTDLAEADTIVIGNYVTQDNDLIPQLMGRRIVRYHNDLARHENPVLRAWVDDNAEHIFTSPMHRERYGISWDHGEGEAHIIPPAIDYARFRPNRETRRHPKREGIVTIACWQNPDKGGYLVAESLARQGATADCYGTGYYVPVGNHIRQCGSVNPPDVPALLWKYEQFIYLPIAPEPFGRCVAEAHFAGCDVLTNDLVGAKWWIENEPDKLETAAEDFWEIVRRG